MKLRNLNSKIFLDSGDPKETTEAISLLGFLDGQTTNPTLITKNPEASLKLERREKFTQGEVLQFYKTIVGEISQLIPSGSVSVEVYSDKQTTSDQMINQAKEMNSWIRNAHIKFPTTTEGLKAAEQVVKMGLRVNMTLCFTQEQAAAVYGATKGAIKGQVFISPFVGRLDDQGENGMDLIKNIIRMYKGGDGHVEVLTASVRNMEHFLYALALKSDIITSPFKILQEWAGGGLQIPDANFMYDQGDRKYISYKELDLNLDWKEFNIIHPLTNAGIEKFSADWNSLLK